MIYSARVDLWFLVLFYGLGTFMLIAAPMVRKRARGGAVAAGLLAVLGLLFVAIGWRTSLVEYVLTPDGYLDATGWPLNGRIAHVTEIQSVEPSNDPRASHAASLDRLRIDYTRSSSGKTSIGRRGLIFIAIIEEESFLDGLAELDPQLIRTRTGIQRLAKGQESSADIDGGRGTEP